MTAATKTPERRKFADMPLSAEAQAGVQALGYEYATPVQAAVFEKVLSGGDFMVQAKTGTGKTTAFGLPVVEKIRVDGATDPQALILCPTRELAVQVAEELAELGDPKGVRVLPIYGGAPMAPQLRSLKAGTDVVVGTPGRVLDHIRRRTLRLVHAHMAVLDEADEMLSMGFWEDVTEILRQLPDERQTLLFSATLPDQIRKTALACMRDPDLIDISRDELTVEGIKNVSYESDERLPKPRNLLYILEVERPENAVIFCNTRDDCSILAAFLRRQGLHALALSGELVQRDREKVMRRMKAGDLKYLVATDIAARGIDISDLSHVVNYSLPDFTEVYLHRVGRTGRAGKKGTAISLVSGRDEMTYTELQRNYGIEFEQRTLPDFEEINRLQAERVAAELLQVARETEITSFLRLADHLKATEAGTEVIGYLLKQHFAAVEQERAKMPVEIGSTRASAEPDDDREDRRRKKRKKKRSREDENGAYTDRDDRSSRRRPRRRRDEDEAAPAPVSAPPPPPAPSTIPHPAERARLFINRGSTDGYDDQKVAELVVAAAGQGAADDVGRIQLRKTHAFVEVTPELADAAVAGAAQGLERDEKPVAIERARTR
ncbi:MAG: DEAD/DEAH box helicase [Myxococcota bacterium]